MLDPINDLEENQLLEKLRNGDEAVFECIYVQYRNEFLSWSASRYPLDETTLLDLYQDAVASLFLKVRENQFDPSRSSVKSYLFGIAQNFVCNQLRKPNHGLSGNCELEDASDKEFYYPAPQEEERYYQQKLEEILKKLSNSYRQLLELYYIEGCSMQEIASRLGYRNKDAVKATKYRCICYVRQFLK